MKKTFRPYNKTWEVVEQCLQHKSNILENQFRLMLGISNTGVIFLSRKLNEKVQR